jgi:hypothetical protein
VEKVDVACGDHEPRPAGGAGNAAGANCALSEPQILRRTPGGAAKGIVPDAVNGYRCARVLPAGFGTERTRLGDRRTEPHEPFPGSCGMVAHS